MKYSAIFWDWNGTLLDDCEFNLFCMNEMLRKRGIEKVSLEKYRDSFGFPIADFYRKIGVDLRANDYAELAEEYACLYKSGRDIPLRKGAKEALAVYRDKKIPQYILSASEKNLLTESLEKYGISKYFVDVIALDNYLAEGKTELARSYCLSHNLNGKAIMVGDTYHDFETASALGWDCLLLTGGHSSESILQKAAVPTVSAPNETYPYILQSGRGERVVKGVDYAFVTAYKTFYDDLKNTNKTEDW